MKENLKLCEIHYLQGRHRQFKEKVPESLKLQRKRKNDDEDEEHKPQLQPNPNVVDDNNVESRVRRTSRIVKKKRKLSEDSDALVLAGSSSRTKKKELKKGDMQLELLRMVLKREAEKNKNNGKKKKNKNKNKNKKKKEKKKRKEEEGELCYSEGELRRELPNGVMEISPAKPSGEYDNVGSHCDVKVGVDCRNVTPRYFRSKNVDRVPVGKLQVCLVLQNNRLCHCHLFICLRVLNCLINCVVV